MRQSRSGPNREIHRIKGLLQATRKISSKQFTNLTHKGTRKKQQTQFKVRRMEEMTKITVEIHITKSKKVQKESMKPSTGSLKR